MLRSLVLTALIIALPVYGLAAVMQPNQCPDGNNSMRMDSPEAAVGPLCDEQSDAQTGVSNDDHLCKNGQECQSRVLSETTVPVILQSFAVVNKPLDHYLHRNLPRRVLNAVWRPPRSV